MKPLTIVTGASRGIGRAIALALAQAGHDLAMVGLAREDALAAAAEQARALGADCSAHLADVSDEASVETLFQALGERLGRLTGVVNNAGFTGARGDLADLPMSEVDRVLGVNLRGAIVMSRKAVPVLGALGRGAIVNLSSQTALFGGNGLAAYAAAKAGLNGLTIALAREVAGSGVRVNAVSPGPVLTEPLQALGAARLADMKSVLPMGRFCTEEEVAAVVVWLLSDQASYVSGAIVPVHGAR